LDLTASVISAGQVFVVDWEEKGYNFEMQLWSGNSIEKFAMMGN
jgi:hypothetical protein